MIEIEHSDSEDEFQSPEDMPLDLKVTLDREVYFVGQEIKGEVSICNEHRRQMRGIRLTLRCKAETVWWDKQKFSFKNTKEKVVKHYNNHDLLYTEKYIVGSGKVMMLEKGNHEFPFSIPIKPESKGNTDLPSNMEFPNGHTRYFIKAEVDWPGAAAHEHERLVSVIDICDLREVKEALQPATFTKTVRVGLTRQKIHIAGRLEKVGYVPGEEILLHVEIDNTSSKRISKYYIQLVEHVRYLASDGKRTTTKHVIVSNEYGAIAPKSDEVFEKEIVLIPPIPQSAKSHVDFLTLTHEVEIVVHVGGSVNSASRRIYIGSIPTKSSFVRFKKQSLPLESVCSWPYSDLSSKQPVPNVRAITPNPDVDYEAIEKLDPEFKIRYLCYLFDRDLAIESFKKESDDDSQVEDDDMEAGLSE